MPGKDKASKSGQSLEKAVKDLAENRGLEVRRQFKLGRRLWGAERRIDLILRDSGSEKTLGIECKAQETPGTAQEKIPATLADIQAWPIPGLVVFSGVGFTDDMKAFLIASGRAVELRDLEPWLRLFFSLPLS